MTALQCNLPTCKLQLVTMNCENHSVAVVEPLTMGPLSMTNGHNDLDDLQGGGVESRRVLIIIFKRNH